MLSKTMEYLSIYIKSFKCKTEPTFVTLESHNQLEKK